MASSEAWVKGFQLFMFDFDGLLVDTEQCHYEAYRMALQRRGHTLPWSFADYCRVAHYSSDGLERGIMALFPGLLAEEGGWASFYRAKSGALLEIYASGAVTMMPGAARLVERLCDYGIACCVVTHSALQLIEPLRRRHPVLAMIPYWITREDYQEPKPHPQCYEEAMRRWLPQGGRAIGFEDSVRGLTALLHSGAHRAVLVSEQEIVDLQRYRDAGVVVCRSLAELDSGLR